MTDFETHPAGTADLVKHLRGVLVMVSVGLRAADRIEELETALAYVGHASAHRITTLEAALTRANAATAAAYEVAASTIEVIVSDAQKEVGSIKLSKVDAAVVEMLNGIAAAIRALATPDQTAALDKLIAEAEAQAVEKTAAMVRTWRNTTPMTGEECADAILAASKKGGV